MEQIFENGAHYSIEFIKLILILVYFFDFKPKKYINIVFGGSLLSIMLIACRYDLSDVSIIYAIIAISITSVCMEGKYKAGIAILSFIAISIFDMLVSLFFISIFNLKFEKVQENVFLLLGWNSVSLLVLIVSIFCLRKRKNRRNIIPTLMLPIYITAGISLTVYLAVLQFVGLGDDAKFYKYEILIGLGVTTLVFAIVCFLLTYNQNENEKLKIENEMNNKVLKAQSEYYIMLLQKEKETKAFRHDIKEHISALAILYQKGQYEKLGAYISDLKQTTTEISSKFKTGHDYINAIATDLSNQYSFVELEWIGKVPELNISYMDICTLFYNLLKNAFEAANECSEKKVRVVVKIFERNLSVTISNPFQSIKLDEDHELISTKSSEGHGFGVQNIKKCVDKNGGKYNVTIDDSMFCTEIILLNVVESEIQE